jgi:hypothetical protein
LEEFVNDLYLFLMEELHHSVNQVRIVEIAIIFQLLTTKQIPAKKPSRIAFTQQLSSPDLMKRFANEAEMANNNILASKYYQSRIADCNWNSDYWYEYAEFLLRIGNTSRAEQCLIEAISLQSNHSFR